MGFRIRKEPVKNKSIPTLPVQNESISPILNLFPEYSALFVKTQKNLMAGNGSLPINQRHYIAMMASSAYNCETLANRERNSFLANGGDLTWLHSPHSVPNRIQKLKKVNIILAETPWLLKPEQIKDLTNGKGSWTVSEIVHALAIISNYHSLSTFVLGTGISSQQTSKSAPKMQNKKEPEFNKENANTQAQEFSWDEQGFSVMSAFYSDMASLFDDKMRAARHLSSLFLAGYEEEKYVKYNQSIWYHVQAQHGIHRDDINNEEIQEVMDENLKMFINICSNGHNTSSHIFTKLGNDLGYSFKVFISIIVMEAKLQSELNYALEAVNKYMIFI